MTDSSPLGAELEEIRGLFPVTTRHAYLLNAAAGPPPAPVVEAIRAHLEEASLGGCLEYGKWVATMERCRLKLAALIGCRGSEIAFTKNTSQGLHLAAASIPWKPGDNVLVGDLEFPANVFPWQMAALRQGIECRTVPSRDGRIALEAIRQVSDARTRAVALSWVQFSNGFRADLEAVSSFCEARDIYFVIDAVQGVGALRMDLSRLGRRTILAGGCHKWLLCPAGVGYLYCPRELLDELLPANWGWLSMRDPFGLRRERSLREDAGRFEEGNHNLMAIAGLEASLDLIARVGIGRIEEQNLWLSERLMVGLAARGYRILTPPGRQERSAIVLFGHPELAASELCRELRRQGVVTIERDGAVRASPHFYNSASEIDRLLAALPSASSGPQL